MKFLHIRVFVVALLLLQVAALPQIKDHLDPGLTMVRIPFDKSQSTTSQGSCGDTSFFPSDPRNVLQFTFDGMYVEMDPLVRVDSVISDTVLAGKVFNKHSMFRFLRYDPEERKLYGWKGTSEGLIANFPDEKPGTFSFCNMTIFGQSGIFEYNVSQGREQIFGIDREVRAFNYGAYGGNGVEYKFYFARGLGLYYAFFAEWGHGNIHVTWHWLKQAKIYDDTGVTLYYNPTDRPAIQVYSLPVETATQMFRAPVRFTHPFSRRYQSGPYPRFYNFIDEAVIEGYYSLGTDSIPARPKDLVFEPLSDSSTIDYPLNDSLMQAGYRFNYRFIAIDKSIIPQSDTLPKNGYFSVRYPLTGIDELPPIELGYNLEQNYPNPFTGSEGSTEIRYTLRQAGRVKGVVYDLLGSEVAVLVDGEIPKGEHTIRFDGKGLSPGVYFFRLTCGGNSKAIKMVVN